VDLREEERGIGIWRFRVVRVCVMGTAWGGGGGPCVCGERKGRGINCGGGTGVSEANNVIFHGLVFSKKFSAPPATSFRNTRDKKNERQ
jgi:hypothetical protein